MPDSHPETSLYAVLTGDLIASSDMTAARLDQVRDMLKTAAGIFSNSFPGSVEIRLDMYRGDAWQLLLNERELALRLGLYLRARLRAVLEADTRVSIGLGFCQVIDRSHLSLSTGEAFTLSGRALDNMTGYFDMTAALPERAGLMCQWLPASVHLISEIVRSWTRRQAEIAGEALLRPQATHEDISQLLVPPVSKQSVTASLGGAGWRALQEPLKAFEETDWNGLLASDGVT